MSAERSANCDSVSGLHARAFVSPSVAACRQSKIDIMLCFDSALPRRWPAREALHEVVDQGDDREPELPSADSVSRFIPLPPKCPRQTSPMTRTSLPRSAELPPRFVVSLDRVVVQLDRPLSIGEGMYMSVKFGTFGLLLAVSGVAPAAVAVATVAAAAAGGRPSPCRPIIATTR